MKSYLNLGCGDRFSTEWTNVDFVSRDKRVIQCNLLKGISFPDGSFDVVYHSHVLEHIPRNLALPFLRECRRVLKQGGIIRIVVPDLEQIAQKYLELLSNADAGDQISKLRYEWILLEMYDQTVRDRPGGEMGDYLRQAKVPEPEFVIGRMGVEGKRTIEDSRTSANSNQPPTIFQRIKPILRAMASPRELVVRLLLGDQYELLEIGRFRRGGEVHLWMYDRYSLKRLLLNAEFLGPRVVNAGESKIPNWESFNLDTEPDGAPYKPGSLYMEAHR